MCLCTAIRTNSTAEPAIDIIDGGATRGANLFHSFAQFSVRAGSIAYFNNTPDIQNIFGRVTGGAISRVDGILRSNGSASLFLVNPNGIIFGPSASLNIGGSFLSSTASSINFADGTQFPIDASQATPVLTVSVPIGLEFSTADSGFINVEGAGRDLLLGNIVEAPNSTGLTANFGKTVALVGGEVSFNGGIVIAPSGRIEVGSVASGLVSINSNSNGISLDYSQVENFQDIKLSGRAFLDASGFLNGNIFLNAKSFILTNGVVSISNFGSLSSGKISITVVEALDISGRPINPFNVFGSPIGGIVTQNFSEGKGANVVVSANQLKIQEAGQFLTYSFGPGEGGNIDINLTNRMQNRESLPSQTSLMLGGIAAITFGSGQAGNITLTTESLSIQNGSTFASETFGSGDSGKITINAFNSVTISEILPLAPNTFLPSFLGSVTTSSGSAGDIEINTQDLIIQKGGRLDSSTLASGDAGDITINAANSVTIDGTGSPTFTLLGASANLTDPFLGQLLIFPTTLLTGASGAVTINTNQLLVRDGGQVGVRNNGTGNAGRLQIHAKSINLNNQGNITADTASGQGGNIALQTESLQLQSKSKIIATASGNGNGGSIDIGSDTLVALKDSDITANASFGNGGRVNIDIQGLFLSPDSDITASSELGIDGVVNIRTLGFDIQNTIVPLQENFTNTEQIVAGSCLSRRNVSQSSFVVTGSGGLPTNPYSGVEEWDSLEVQLEANNDMIRQRETDSADASGFATLARSPSLGQTSPNLSSRKWKIGDPIVEAQGIVKTADGRTLLGMLPQGAVFQPAQSLICPAN